MIQAIELRNGNLISVDKQTVIFDHFELADSFKGFAEGADICYRLVNGTFTLTTTANKASGVPLTKSVFLDCGFTKQDDGYWVKKISLRQYLAFMWGDANKATLLQKMGEGDYSIIPLSTAPMQYLHQLQNLFYCLSGQELTIG